MRREWLKPFLKYIYIVYGMSEKIKGLHEPRKQPQIHGSMCFFTLFMGAVFRIKSLNQLNGWIRIGRLKRLVLKGGRIPYQDTLRRLLKGWNIYDLTKINQSVVKKAIRNGVFRKGTIQRWKVVAIDGVELFGGTKKSCEDCLTRVKDEITHYYHSAVVCMSVGSDPHIIYGAEFLHSSQDSDKKNEGELTGAKRLLKKLHQTYHHFADIIVADALYLNRPFLEATLSHKMHAVIRMKKEELTLMKDAKGLFARRAADETWTVEKKNKVIEVKVWKDHGFIWDNLNHPLSVYRFVETIASSNQVSSSSKETEMWVVTTLEASFEASFIWEVMHKRWDIENNGFRELKTKWHSDHCFVHDPNALEAFFTIQIIAFNCFQLFLFQRLHYFRKSSFTQELVVESMRTEAHTFSGLTYMLSPP